MENRQQAQTARDTTKANSNSPMFPKNFNNLKHLVSGSMTSEKGLQWVVELRSGLPPQKTTRRLPDGAPKSHTASRVRVDRRKAGEVLDVPVLKKSSSEFMHLARHRVGIPANGSQLRFETGLREYHRSATDKRPEWNNISAR